MASQPTSTRYHLIGKWGRGRVRTVDLTPRDLLYLRALFICGVLSNEMLHALVCPRGSQRTTTDRMFLLKNPPNDYVVQPNAQENSMGANYTSLSYEISDKGVETLVERGAIAFAEFVFWKKSQAAYKPQHFDHDFATGYILGSIELGVRVAGLQFISSAEIVNRERCPAETRAAPNPFAIPYDVGEGQRHLIPDALFGIEYPSGACFFALETDMGTEQLRDNEKKNATITRKLRGYREIIRRETFKARFGLPTPQVLFVTASVVRMRNMMESAARLADTDANWPIKRFQFKALPDLARRTRARLPSSGHLLTEPWARVDAPPCDISRL